MRSCLDLMEDCLCHYTEGKGKKREVVKVEEESGDGKYHITPRISRLVVGELILFHQAHKLLGFPKRSRDPVDVVCQIIPPSFPMMSQIQ